MATSFAVAVFGIMLAEQTLLNAAVLTIDATTTDAALAGFVFNALLIARAPLQLFQAIQSVAAPPPRRPGRDRRRRGVRARRARHGPRDRGLRAEPWRSGCSRSGRGRWASFSAATPTTAAGGLALVALGMGFHLVAGTLNQAALARGEAPLAAFAWLLCAGLFVLFTITDYVADELLRVELAYFGSAWLLSVLLWALYRRPTSSTTPAAPPAISKGINGRL